MDLTRLEAAAAGLESLPETGEEADYVGRLDKVIRTLQGHRKVIMDELPGPVTGSAYRIAEERYSERSYNGRLIREAFARNGWTLDDLVDLRIVELKWRWSDLRNAFIAQDLGLRVAGHEISEEEADHVGEVWKSRYKVEGVS